jgi:hypothetical protein
LAPHQRSLPQIALLETWLETGLRIDTGKLVLLLETFSHGLWRLTAYYLGVSTSGDLISGLDYANGPLELALIEGAGFVGQSDLDALDVQPDYLRRNFWIDLAEGFRQPPRFRRSRSPGLPRGGGDGRLVRG